MKCFKTDYSAEQFSDILQILPTSEIRQEF